MGQRIRLGVRLPGLHFENFGVALLFGYGAKDSTRHRAAGNFGLFVHLPIGQAILGLPYF